MDVNAFAPRDEAATDNCLDSNSSDHGFDPPTISRHATLLARMAGWSEEDDRRVAEMMSAGRGYGEIAEALGKKRGAIRRRVVSLGIERTPEWRSTQLLNRWRFGRTQIRVVNHDPIEFPEARVFGLENLQKGQCRYICNDDMRAPVYCGLPILATSRFSFCSAHNRICCEPPRKRA
jgi:hypothetical protein